MEKEWGSFLWVAIESSVDEKPVDKSFTYHWRENI